MRPGRLLGLACAAWLLAASVVAQPVAPPPLVVLVIVDGLPQRQLTAYADQFAADGFNRFLREGAVYTQAHHAHAHTVTAPGHASLLTGAYAQRHGIIANEWRDPASGEATTATTDPAAVLIGHAPLPQDGTSPRLLLAETLGDVLRRLRPQAKVLSVAGKDRSAILAGGHAGTAYMYVPRSGRFASSSWYMQRHPAWVDAFHAGRPADRWFRAEWQPLLPPAAYARSVPDDQPWFGLRGGRLPMRLAGSLEIAPGQRYHEALLASPFADALTLEFARAAVQGEQIGRDAVPDLLVIGLSAHDIVNHTWSAESRLSHDHLLQLDRLLQDFFQALDAEVGRDRYLAALSSDHGFMPAAEAQGGRTGRIATGQLVARVNAELERRFGAAPLVAFASASGLVLDRRLLAARSLASDAVAAAAREAVAAQPGIAAAYTRAELASGSRVGAPYFEAMQRSWHPQRSGDVQYTPQSGWLFGNGVASHGSAQPYDTHVPLLLWGPRWVRPGRIATPVEAVDLVTTLAGILGLPPPAQAQGRPLPQP
ncbi:MAG TPA: alkaline phosphatase family protein [Ramlibacter sp.]|nr:alkaline phosphatase family protein [Ramlibacter sp.]